MPLKPCTVSVRLPSALRTVTSVCERVDGAVGVVVPLRGRAQAIGTGGHHRPVDKREARVEVADGFGPARRSHSGPSHRSGSGRKCRSRSVSHSVVTDRPSRARRDDALVRERPVVVVVGRRGHEAVVRHRHDVVEDSHCRRYRATIETFLRRSRVVTIVLRFSEPSGW